MRVAGVGQAIRQRDTTPEIDCIHHRLHGKNRIEQKQRPQKCCAAEQCLRQTRRQRRGGSVHGGAEHAGPMQPPWQAGPQQRPGGAGAGNPEANACNVHPGEPCRDVDQGKPILHHRIGKTEQRDKRAADDGWHHPGKKPCDGYPFTTDPLVQCEPRGDIGRPSKRGRDEEDNELARHPRNTTAQPSRTGQRECGESDRRNDER